MTTNNVEHRQRRMKGKKLPSFFQGLTLKEKNQRKSQEKKGTK